MAPRRSSRAVPTKPPSAPVTKSAPKAAAKPRSHPARKRAASPSRDEAPAPKRTRTAPPSQKSENIPPVPTRKPRSKPSSVTKPQPTTRKRGRPKLDAITEAVEPKETKPLEKKKKAPLEPKQKPAPIPQSKPYFNSLPTSPPTSRPGLVLFAWGAGNFGQFGMGSDVLDSLTKPRRSQWVEDQMSKGTFGEVGAGLTAVAGGGLHTLFTDEKGTVREMSSSLSLLCSIFPRYGLVALMITPHSAELPRTFLILTMKAHSSTLMSSLVGLDQYKL